MLTLHGVAKPVYRAFQMLHGLGNEQLPKEGDHQTVRCWVVRKDDEITALIVNHGRPQHPIETEKVKLQLMDGAQANSPVRPSRATVRRIDDEHANPRRRWEEMGKPGYLDQYQLSELQAASQLHAEPLRWQSQDGGISVSIDIPPQGVAAITIPLNGMEREA